MFSYAEVENALATLFKLEPSKIGAFRGRIKNFQKLGLSPSRPGRGTKIEYTREDVVLWGMCLLLLDVGFSPTAISGLAKNGWRLESAALDYAIRLDGIHAQVTNKLSALLANNPAQPPQRRSAVLVVE